MDCLKSWSVDAVLLAKRMTEILDRSFTSAKIIDRGAYATVYQLIDASVSPASSSSLRRGVQPVVVRISSRPVYNDVAIDQEKQKILTFVATLDEIKASAPKQVQRRVPRILAYDASHSTEFGHGWIAMTRLAGTPLAECWYDFDQEKRNKTIEELAGFTRKLARFRSSHQISSMTAKSSFHFGRLLSPVTKHNSVANQSAFTSLSLPRRNGANNLRPFNLQSSRPLEAVNTTATSQPSSTASYLMSAVDAEIAFLRQHQKGAVRCFNMNMLRLRQCGLDEEIPADAALGSTTTSIYRNQLKALGDLAQSILGARTNSLQHDLNALEEFVLAHLDLSLENLLVDPETGALTGVLDWEFAGFVPAWLALSPPPFISAKEEELPSWTEDGWACSIPENDQEDEEDDLAKEEKQVLCQLWQDTISTSWDDYTESANSAKTVNCDIAKEKRMLWKACMSEWHQLGKACAWARGIATSHSIHPDLLAFSDQIDLNGSNESIAGHSDGPELQHQIDGHFQQAVGRLEIDLSTTDSEGYTTKEDDDLLSVQARCRSPSTAESSIGPYTPVDAVPALDLPVVGLNGRVTEHQGFDVNTSYQHAHPKGLATYSETADDEDSDEDEDEDGDEEDEEEEDDDDNSDCAPMNDLDFEEFAMAFEPAPLPHTLTVGITAPHSTPTSVQLSFSESRTTVPLPDLSSLSVPVSPNPPQSLSIPALTHASPRTSTPVSTSPNTRAASVAPIVSISLPSPAVSTSSGMKLPPPQVDIRSRTQYKRDFAQWMNSSAPPEQIPSSSLWLAFWETPKIDMARDLEFKVERDLDAGW